MELLPTPAEWQKMLWPEVSWGEKILRGLLVYAFLLVATRLFGKKELAQSSLSDLLLVLLLANITQNAMIGEDNSVVGAFAGTLAMMFLWFLINKATSRSEKLDRVVEGIPSVIIRDGEMLKDVMKKESLAESELFTFLRQQGIKEVSEVQWGILEADGQISILKKQDVEGGETTPQVWKAAVEMDAGAKA
jgi:uncharacterized membrane protein YcaP (DUF421 family)